MLKPDKLDTDPNSSVSAKEWKHWFRTFNNFLGALTEPDKFAILINFVSPRIYEYIENSGNYDEAIATLEKLYVKPTNEVFARYKLATRRQQSGESLDEFLQGLMTLAKDCNYKDVNAATYRDESIRDAFITGLSSNQIRQRLLENKTLNLEAASSHARALRSAQRSAESYSTIDSYGLAASASHQETSSKFPEMVNENEISSPVLAAVAPKCFFCGNKKHSRAACPAKDAVCNRCQKKGHFAKVCKSNPPLSTPISSVNAAVVPYLAAVATSNEVNALQQSYLTVRIGNFSIKALIDSGSSESFIHPDVVKKCNLSVNNQCKTIALAQASSTAQTSGTCQAVLFVNDREVPVNLSIMPGLCSDIILGVDFQKHYRAITFHHGGVYPPLEVCGLTTLKVKLPELFANLTADCRPVAAKRRNYSAVDRKFIDNEVRRMLKEGIIEQSTSPWRAQVVVTRETANHKKRLAIDYSETINRFTLLDGYPLPRIEDTVNNIAQVKVFSMIDLRSAYHQVAIPEKDKPYTAFQAGNGFYQFTRIPFGVTNGVACFQRVIDDIISTDNLKGTFAYLDNVTICGVDQADHDENLRGFLESAAARNITFNDDKSTFSTRRLAILGSIVEDGSIRPDPERLRPLMELPLPCNVKSLRRALGFFSHYSKWIRDFSRKIRPLTQLRGFPLTGEAKSAFYQLRQDIEQSVLASIDEDRPFQLETDASDAAIAGVLSQGERPVAFFSRTLHASELKQPSVEKEALAIIESVRHWRHFLTGTHFSLRTDQKSVSYMFNKHHSSKIKNDKIMRWRVELSCLSYNIEHKAGVLNVAPDTLSRCCSASGHVNLERIHSDLCHPGITRLFHFVRSHNLPYSLEDVKRVISCCRVCAECKPRFYRPTQHSHLIKSSQPFERLNIDFKGPLESDNHNVYFLNIVDEYSRFPFVYPCKDTSAPTVISCLHHLFSLFGTPSSIHSDKGSAFISRELREWLSTSHVSISHTTRYNPQGNGQVEKYNDVVWRAIKMALKTKQLPISKWQTVLPEALHAIRSLLCTAVNETPHERLFKFSRRSSTGESLPGWLSRPGPVFLKRHVRNKNHPLVDEVELIHANPQYASVKLADGTEKSVSIHHLAPCPSGPETDGFGKGTKDCSEELKDTLRFHQLPRDSPTVPTASDVIPTSQLNVNDVNVSCPDSTLHVSNDVPKEAISEVPTLGPAVPYTEAAPNIPIRRSGRIRNPVVKLDL